MKIESLPIWTAFIFTCFILPWKSNPHLFYYRADRKKVKLLEYLDRYVDYKTGLKWNIHYHLPKKIKKKFKNDVLTIRFTKNKVELINPIEIDAPTYSWDMGSVEYYDNGYWRRLSNTLDYNESLVVPIVINNNTFTSNEVLLSILPKEFRVGSDGEEAWVYLKD